MSSYILGSAAFYATSQMLSREMLVQAISSMSTSIYTSLGNLKTHNLDEINSFFDDTDLLSDVQVISLYIEELEDSNNKNKDKLKTNNEIKTVLPINKSNSNRQNLVSGGSSKFLPQYLNLNRVRTSVDHQDSQHVPN